MLDELGHEVKTIAGKRQVGADYIIPELEYDDPELVKIKENAFFEMKDYKYVDELLFEIDKVAARIKRQLDEIQAREKFDVIFVHNIFSHIVNLPASRAWYEFTRQGTSQIIGVHHDFYWDGRNAQVFQPTSDEIRKFTSKYLPPQLDNLRHVVINTINQQRLRSQCGINSTIVPDTFDFDQEPWVKDMYNQTLSGEAGLKDNDLVVLQATRVVERKGIELAIDFAAGLDEKKTELAGHTLYNGKKITKDSRVVLMLAGYTENFAKSYREKLEDHILHRGIEAVFVDYMIDSERGQGEGRKIYSLWDTYVYADLVTYPSLWEGWGNQFIEAVFAKKPLVVFEYPVFKTDIKSEGYDYISLGDSLGMDRANRLVTVPDNHLAGAVWQACRMLTDSKTEQILEDNWQLGDRYHGETVLKRMLETLLMERATAANF